MSWSRGNTIPADIAVRTRGIITLLRLEGPSDYLRRRTFGTREHEATQLSTCGNLFW
jgi:hypothetical protein